MQICRWDVFIAAAVARTGDPNGPDVPRWPAFDRSTRPAMIFDDHTRPRGARVTKSRSNPMRPLFILLAGLSLGACQTAATSPTDFMARNARAPGMLVQPGLQYRILKSGPEDGVYPKLSDEVMIHYEGSLLTGEVFDSSFARGKPETFVLKKLIPGWEIIVRQMKPGDEWEVFVPPEMAYGPKAVGPIPANSVLKFRIALIEARAPKKDPAARD